MNKTKLVTHCDLDGIGCAVLAKLAFGEDVDISYCNYDNIDEEVEKLVEDGDAFKSYDNIFITDISVSDDIANMIDILDRGDRRVVLLDHHATALGLNKYEWCEVRVENANGVKTCGTEMFCEGLNRSHLLTFDEESLYFRNIEQFVRYVRDYDTWRWKELENGYIAKRLNDLFYIYGRDKFIEWCIENINCSDSTLHLFPHFSEADLALLENKQKEIDKYIEEKDKQLIRYYDTFGYICGVVFAERFFNELGNRLAELHPELHYIAMIDIADGKVSYRGVKDEIDLGGEIAHSYGGGGHKKAAGSTFDGKSMEFLVLDWLFNKGKTTREHIRYSIYPACNVYNDDIEFADIVIDKENSNESKTEK